VNHFQEYARVIQESLLQPGELIVDIGSNDGVLLQFFTEKYRVLGIEPSGNVAKVAQEKGIETLKDFFTPTLASKLLVTHGPAKVVTANNVFAHIDNIGEIVEGVKRLLQRDGVYVFEAHYVLDFIQKVEFDTVYHEHLCYYSVKALQHLFDLYDMDVFDVVRVPQHGGSIRVFVCNKGVYPIASSVVELCNIEKEAGLYSKDVYFTFQDKVNDIAGTLRDLVKMYSQEGKIVIGYGAPAKGNPLLNLRKSVSSHPEAIFRLYTRQF
jgi:ubiquinone/menaquinone biosynthesis C-methylase UbiE